MDATKDPPASSQFLYQAKAQKTIAAKTAIINEVFVVK